MGTLDWMSLYLNHYLTTKGLNVVVKWADISAPQTSCSVTLTGDICQNTAPWPGEGAQLTTGLSIALWGWRLRELVLCPEQQLQSPALAYNTYSCVFPFDCIKQPLLHISSQFCNQHVEHLIFSRGPTALLCILYTAAAKQHQQVSRLSPPLFPCMCEGFETWNGEGTMQLRKWLMVNRGMYNFMQCEHVRCMCTTNLVQVSSCDFISSPNTLARVTKQLCLDCMCVCLWENDYVHLSAGCSLQLQFQQTQGFAHR